MNKNLSMILNGVLLVAVAILYYLHFTECKTSCETVAKGTDSTVVAKPIVMAPTDIKSSKIVFVNLDVLSEGYLFLKDVGASVQAEQASLQNQYQTKGQKPTKDFYLKIRLKQSKTNLLQEKMNWINFN
jgi:outer membrane protein